jgi:hypothetical protein
MVADKGADGNVQMIPIFEYRGSMTENRSAFQPVLDALQIKPFLLSMDSREVVITEGIYDYYALELFKQEHEISCLPSVGAESIQFYVSLMIAWGVKFWALWDNDEGGRKAHAKAEKEFGSEIAGARFRMLPLRKGMKNRILQNLFEGRDLVMLREELNLAKDTPFDKTLAAWFYAPNRQELLVKMSPLTRQNFEEVYGSL